MRGGIVLGADIPHFRIENSLDWFIRKTGKAKNLKEHLNSIKLKKSKYWTVDDDTHVLVIGTTRSGKSRRLIVPSIWHLAQHGESMIVCDLKKELQPITKEYLELMGYKIITLDFRTPTTGNRWNMLNPVVNALQHNNTTAAIQSANDIAHALSYDSKSHHTDPLWPAGKKALISSLILAVAIEAPPGHKNMTSVRNLLAYLGQDGGKGLDEYFTDLPDNHPATDSYQVYRMSRDKIRDSFATDTLSTLQLFKSDPAIVWMGAEQDHDLASAGQSKTAVFLVIPDERNTYNVLASLYIQQSYSALIDVANQNRGRLPLRVNYLLDEFGNIPAIADFTTKITTAGGRNIRFTLAVQGIDQLAKLYPYEESTIAGQCWTWIYILTADQKTAKMISDKAGKYTVATETYNSSAQVSGSYSQGVTQGLTSRALVMEDEVTRPPEDSALVLRTRLQPAIMPLPDISRWPIINQLDIERTGVPDPEKTINLPEPWLPDKQASGRKPSPDSKDLEDERSIDDIFGF